MAKNEEQEPRRKTGEGITREMLEADLAGVRKQKEQALAVYRQAEGAELVICGLLEKL